MAQSDTNTITTTFQERIKGYHGTRTATLSRDTPDSSISRDDLLVGKIFADETHQHKSLVKFTGLDLPADAKILSAHLSLFCQGFSGQPRIAAYGLLKNFSEGNRHGGQALAGATTWNALHYGKAAWSAPGAGKTSDRFDYDAEADVHAPPDATEAVQSVGWFTWDVTSSFTDQRRQGKEYGWALEEATGHATTYAVFVSPHADVADKPLLLYPRLTLTYVTSAPGQSVRSGSGPQLISFYLGDPTHLNKDLKRVARLPFDGAVFDGEDNRHLGSGEGILNISVFGPDELKLENYSQFIESTRRISSPPSPLRTNFLRITTVPGTLERKQTPYDWDSRPRRNEKVTMWYSDFSPILHNITVAATVAREAGMRGILFDWEEYGGNIFSYAQLKDAQEQGKSLEETKQQVRKRAEEFIQAINAVYPDMTLIIIPHIYSGGAPELFAAFLDGVIVAADPRMRIVDGNEKYSLASAEQFWTAYDFNYDKAPTFCTVPEKYLRQVEVGFGVWLNKDGWSRDPERDYSSARWQTKLENALLVSDGYVWVFTGGGGKISPDWWTGAYLPPAYIEATRRAKDLVRAMKPN
jgi:hypothetical protein